MMRYTAPAQYAALCNRLPVISEPKERLVEKIVAIQLKWQEDYARRYPRVARGSRPTDHSADADYVTSFETYLRCELYTYSERTLRAILSHVRTGAPGRKHDDSESWNIWQSCMVFLLCRKWKSIAGEGNGSGKNRFQRPGAVLPHRPFLYSRKLHWEKKQKQMKTQRNNRQNA